MRKCDRCGHQGDFISEGTSPVLHLCPNCGSDKGETHLADVTVTIEDGRVDVTIWNMDTVVEIRNYDIGDMDRTRLTQDDDGDYYLRTFSDGA